MEEADRNLSTQPITFNEGDIIVGVDLAWLNTGLTKFRVNRDKSLQKLDSLLVKNDSCRFFSRSFANFIEASESMHNFCFRATHVVVEYGFGSQSSQAAKSLGLSWGLMMSCVLNACMNASVFLVHPLQVKDYFTTDNKTVIRMKLCRMIEGMSHEKSEHIIDSAAVIAAIMNGAKYEKIQ